MLIYVVRIYVPLNDHFEGVVAFLDLFDCLLVSQLAGVHAIYPDQDVVQLEAADLGHRLGTDLKKEEKYLLVSRAFLNFVPCHFVILGYDLIYEITRIRSSGLVA